MLRNIKAGAAAFRTVPLEAPTFRRCLLTDFPTKDGLVNLIIDQDTLSNLKTKEEEIKENEYILGDLGNRIKHPTYI